MKHFERIGKSIYKKYLSLEFERSTAKKIHTSYIRKNTPLKWSYSMAEVNRPLVGLTIGQMLQNSADKFGDSEAIVSCHQEISKTYLQINNDATEFATGLLAIGFEPGDRIGIWAPNYYEWCLTMFAAAKAGLILVNINPGFRIAELKYCLNNVGVRGIVCASTFKTSNYYNMIAEIAPEILTTKPSTYFTSKELPKLNYIIKIDDAEENGVFNFKNVLGCGTLEDKQRLEKLSSKIQFDQPFNIQFTSGTTGQPKPAVLSHFNIVNNANFLGIRREVTKNKERVILSAPLFHCFGSIVGMLSNLIHGGTTIIPCPGFEPITILRGVKENRATSLLGTPTMFFDILREFRKNPFEIEHLHAGIMSGASCPEDLVLSIMNELKIKDMCIPYGLTETSPVLTSPFPNDSLKIRTSTVGYPLDHTELKIVDENRELVPINVPGELLVRGYSVFLEYWNDKERTKEVVGKDGWFKTGDIAVMDENKYLNIVGRIKDMIIRGGENIYPAEIENFFLSYPEISEAQVFGVPDKRMGEEVAMWIISKTKNLSDEKVRNWAKGKISHFKIPRYIMVVENFPKTISGKVKKFEMKKEMLKHLKL